MSQIITFYSFKGGVGRTMALANVACLIASQGRKVLIVDWDLEAPGLHRYFTNCEIQGPAEAGGLIGLLEEMGENHVANSSSFECTIKVGNTEFFSGCELSMLQSGLGYAEYERKVLDFDLEEFYIERKGATKLETLRQSWRERFDFVLIDSRTGITDTGGICTIFMPDVLAIVFTANEQSLFGAVDIARRAQKGRQTLSFDRKGLTVFPIPSRIDRTEQEESDLWMNHFTDELSPFLASWCPRDVAPRLLLERIKIPHAPYFSFGEKLPVVSHSLTDLDLPGLRYQNISCILEGEFAESAIKYACGLSVEGKQDTLFPVDISRIMNFDPPTFVGRKAEIELLNIAWSKAQNSEYSRPHILAFVGLGGEGKTALVAHWAKQLLQRNWPGTSAIFAWSFYSQGTTAKSVVTSDIFLAEALKFFDDAATAESSKSVIDKAKRLAQIVGERKVLLILDGVDQLQYAPKPPMDSRLKDEGIAALLKALAQNNKGLCIVTTRYAISDLRAHFGKSVQEEKLLTLPSEAGVALLQSYGVHGSLRKNIPAADGKRLLNEFEKLVEDFKGHALTLNLLGSYLRDAHNGDIRKSNLIKLQEANAEEQGGHAFHVMDAYVKSFENDGETEDDRAKGRLALALLRLLGLFDRPASADCLHALWTGEAIGGLTDALIGITDVQRNLAIKRLEDARLLTVNREESSGALISLDAHPLIREYFVQRLREEKPEAFRAAHLRLYKHLRDTTKEGNQPTLEDLQPLFQAVAHGCLAKVQQETCEDVFYSRIRRRDEYYSVNKLGAWGSDLGAITCFFESAWGRVDASLSKPYQSWILSEAAFDLRALGRLAESLEPMRAGAVSVAQAGDWKNAARCHANLTALGLTLGQIESAVSDATQSVEFAELSGEGFLRTGMRTVYAMSLHQAGRAVEAHKLFREAEEIQAEREPLRPLLYSLPGFEFCDLLLAQTVNAAWRISMTLDRVNFESVIGAISSKAGTITGDQSRALRDVSERARRMFDWRDFGDPLLDIALDNLTLGRVELLSAIPGELFFGASGITLEKAVDGLRRAGHLDHLPHGLLSRSWFRSFVGPLTGPDSAQEDLDEAWEIAERGPMRLHMCDIHLYRARLFFREEKYPWDKDEEGNPRGPEDDLAAAEALIEKCGYHRRDEELADAKAVILPYLANKKK